MSHVLQAENLDLLAQLNEAQRSIKEQRSLLDRLGSEVTSAGMAWYGTQ